jgi:hypothetical protein
MSIGGGVTGVGGRGVYCERKEELHGVVGALGGRTCGVDEKDGHDVGGAGRVKGYCRVEEGYVRHGVFGGDRGEGVCRVVEGACDDVVGGGTGGVDEDDRHGGVGGDLVEGVCRVEEGHGMVLLVLLVEEHVVWIKTTDMVGLVVIVLKVYVVWRRGACMVLLVEEQVV